MERIGVAGAGTMGSGIAQVAALGGFATRLYDPDDAALSRGTKRLEEGLAKGEEKGLWTRAERHAARERVAPAPALQDLGDCDLVIEACPEDMALKRELFGRLAGVCRPAAILATNTSSLSVSEIAEGMPGAERICGMHFFNPPALMRLVEVVAGRNTAEGALAAVVEVGAAMGREPVRCADSPGFIVNRCNRPFTLESLRILSEGVASHAQIDAVMREEGGYRMGPFELMDLIGIDVNLEVARSFYAQRAEPRWKPHPIQEEMVAAGRLGRKCRRGFYDYGDGARREVPAAMKAVTRRAILERVVAQLANEASFAAGEGVAQPKDIDAAMRLGLNHPRGPFEWIAALGADRLVAALDELGRTSGDGRYEVAPTLRDRAAP